MKYYSEKLDKLFDTEEALVSEDQNNKSKEKKKKHR